MSDDDPELVYRGYLECLNARDWPRLGAYVHPDVVHNGRALGLDGYRAMLEGDVRAIPNLVFRADWLVVDASRIGARLAFDCTPVGELFGLSVDGRRVQFTEHVFYQLRAGRIADVRSIVDTAAIAAQIGA